MAKRRNLTPEQAEKNRQIFANMMRGTRTQHVLRRIADAYDASMQFDELGLDRKFNFYRILTQQNQASCMIGTREISYSQARIVYDMVFKGKYGGIDRKNKTSECLPLFSRKLSEGQMQFQRPEGWFPGIDYASVGVCDGL